MGVPATNGSLKTSIADMNIGDYIKGYSSTSSGTWVFNVNTADTTEIPYTGASGATTNQGGVFYYVKIAKGLLVGDRINFHSVSWDGLNTGRLIQGKPQTFDNIPGIIRSLAGGVAYADVNGNKSLTDLGLGAFPVNNEWDKYIANFPQELIQSGKTLDDVFHWNGIWTWTQDTPIVSLSANTSRYLRGKTTARTLAPATSNTSVADRGFRPVFEFKES